MDRRVGQRVVAALAVAARVGDRVLDLCAAPGGKTMQLAAAGHDVHLDQPLRWREVVEGFLATLERAGVMIDRVLRRARQLTGVS